MPSLWRSAQQDLAVWNMTWRLQHPSATNNAGDDAHTSAARKGAVAQNPLICSATPLPACSPPLSWRRGWRIAPRQYRARLTFVGGTAARRPGGLRAQSTAYLHLNDRLSASLVALLLYLAYRLGRPLLAISVTFLRTPRIPAVVNKDQDHFSTSCYICCVRRAEGSRLPCFAG